MVVIHSSSYPVLDGCLSNLLVAEVYLLRLYTTHVHALIPTLFLDHQIDKIERILTFDHSDDVVYLLAMPLTCVSK